MAETERSRNDVRERVVRSLLGVLDRTISNCAGPTLITPEQKNLIAERMVDLIHALVAPLSWEDRCRIANTMSDVAGALDGGASERAAFFLDERNLPGG